MKKIRLFAITITCLFIFSTITSASSIDLSVNQTFLRDKDMISSYFLYSTYDIIIPDNYSTIQEGLNNAKPGYKILVKSGIYKENLSIKTKDIILQGQNTYNTILDGCNSGEDGILIDAENVTVQGFTITKFRAIGKLFWDQAGIKVYKPNATIKNNRLVENRWGIEIYVLAYNSTIINNELIGDGISLGNYFNHPYYPNLTLKDFLHTINGNTVNDLPLYYYIDRNDFTVPIDVGQLILVNCTNVTVENLYMTKNDFSMIFAYCNNCTIQNNNVSDTEGEILFYCCENNTIQNNTITNTFKAICLEFKSKNNIVRYNDCSKNVCGISVFLSANNNKVYENVANNNEQFGIEIISCHGGKQWNNTLSKNQVKNNYVGVFLSENCINNTIQNNSIKRNRIGIYLSKSSNDNCFKYNNIQGNLISAIFFGCTKNCWYKNYWNRPRLLPKAVKGIRNIGKLPIPWVNFDFKPSLKPNIVT